MQIIHPPQPSSHRATQPLFRSSQKALTWDLFVTFSPKALALGLFASSSKRTVIGVFSSAFLLFAACAPSLRDPNQKPSDIKVKTLPGPPVSLKEQRPGVWEVQINASNPDQWVYFAFGQDTEIKPETPTNKDKRWNLAFRRYFAKTNSGISGEGDTTIALLRDKDFDAIEKAPSDGYLADETGNNVNEPRSTFGREGEWYYYDLLKHVLTPRPEFLYVARTAEKKYYKIQMLKYYDDKGNSGFPRFRYAEIAAP